MIQRRSQLQAVMRRLMEELPLVPLYDPFRLYGVRDGVRFEPRRDGMVRVFDVSLDTSSPSKLALVAELRKAIQGGDIEVHVQPKVDAPTGRLTGVEALARWRTPSRR